MKKAVPFDKSILSDFDTKPTLLLHSCCAPCSSSVLEMLCECFQVTVLYYNPNIFPKEEFDKRCDEQRKFCESFSNDERKIDFICTSYRSEDFEKIAKGREHIKEGGERCTLCYALRLEEAAKYASEKGFDFFTTTLSVSPLKDAKRLNAIGESMAKKYNVKYLTSDFKKQNGYKRSCEISKEYNMYRQDFCGCEYSLKERLMSAKGFVFDADGTLFDTMEFYDRFVLEIMRLQGIDAPYQLREETRGHTVRGACEYMKEKYLLQKSVDELMDECNEILVDFYKTKAPLKKGVKEFLDYSKENGKKLCIATATDSFLIHLALDSHNIEDYFEFVLCCTDVGASKRESKVYDDSVAKLGLEKKDVVVFEDAEYAIATAKNAGYRVVAIEDDSQSQFVESIKSLGDVYIESMEELIIR